MNIEPSKTNLTKGSALSEECDKLYRWLKNTHASYFANLRERVYLVHRQKCRRQHGKRRLRDRLPTDPADIQKAFMRYLDSPPQAASIPAPQYRSHNKYSQYFPIKVSERLVDEFTRSFPVMKWYREEGFTEKLNKFYAELKNEMAHRKDGYVEAWMQFRRKWIWTVDLEEQTYMLLMLRNIGMESLDWIQGRFRGVCKDAIYEKLILMDSHFRNSTAIHRNLRVTVDSRESINETSIVKAAKELFCPVCLVYECEDHQREEIAYGRDSTFCHPKNLISRADHLKHAVKLLEDFDLIHQNAYVAGARCSQHCYRQLTSQSYSAYFQKNQPFLSPVVTALVRLGIQMFSYQPCQIFLLTGTDTTCALIYIYLFEQYNIRTKIQQNNYDTELNNLANQLFLECSLQEEPSARKKVTQRIKNRDQTNCKINSIPICTHYFLGDDQPANGHDCKNCACSVRGFCVPLCQCNPEQCSRQRKRCNCKDDCLKQSCPCYSGQMECDQDMCGCIKSQSKQSKKSLIGCSNMQIQLGRVAKLRVGCSSIPQGGLGAFSVQQIKKNHLVAIYKGQIIDFETEALRQLVSKDQSIYTFSFKSSAIDAKYMGGRARFINHNNRELENLRTQIKFSDADYYLCLFAKRDIYKGEELFFNYDGDGLLFKQFRDKYPYIQSNQK